MSDAENVTPIREPVEKATGFSEIGGSGLYTTGGRVRDEFHRQLRGTRAIKVYREMSDNDPVVGGILFIIDMLLREVNWRADPSADDTAPEGETQADFVWSCVNDMSITWPQFVSAALSFLPYGWSFFEVVYKKRNGFQPPNGKNPSSNFEDGKIGWRKFALRAQESLLKWEFDDEGGMQAFIQMTPQGNKTIPIELGLLFRTTAARSNPEGRSVLRNAYRPWYFKKRIEETEAIGIERELAGLPVALVPGDYLDANASAEKKAAIDAIKTILRDVRVDDQTSIVFPREIDPDTHQDRWELKLLSTGGSRRIETDPIVGRYAQQIAMSVLADVILLGHENTGAYSLANVKLEMFTTALDAYLDEIASVLNAYAIPPLMQRNGVPENLWPTLGHDQVRRVDLKELGDFVTAITGGGVVIDPPMEERLREVAGLPQPESEESTGP